MTISTCLLSHIKHGDIRNDREVTQLHIYVVIGVSVDMLCELRSNNMRPFHRIVPPCVLRFTYGLDCLIFGACWTFSFRSQQVIDGSYLLAVLCNRNVSAWILGFLEWHRYICKDDGSLRALGGAKRTMLDVTHYNQRTAAITGAGSCLGRDIALSLAAKHYRVLSTAIS
jgi:hypothetical protein